MKNPIRMVHVVSPPIGEAPIWVREAWVGLDLPTRKSRPISALTFGVLSWPKSRTAAIWRLVTRKTTKMIGYPVDALKAVEILEGQHPEAAAWWRENTPHLMRR